MPDMQKETVPDAIQQDNIINTELTQTIESLNFYQINASYSITKKSVNIFNKIDETSSGATHAILPNEEASEVVRWMVRNTIAWGLRFLLKQEMFSEMPHPKL